MTDGLGAAFLAVTLVLVLLGIALGVLAVGVVGVLWSRRTGRLPDVAQYLLALGLAGVVVVAGFGIAVLAGPAPEAAGLFAMLTVVPIALAAGVGFRRLPDDWLAVLATTTVSWAVAFLPGLFVAAEVMNALRSTVDPSAPASAGLPWLAALISGVGVALAMVFVGSRLGPVMRSERWGEQGE